MLKAPTESGWNRTRHWQLAFQWGAALAGLALIARMYSWQVLHHADLAQRAALEHVGQETIPADRGTIYDANGEALVTNVSYDLVFAVPSQLENPSVAAEKLAPILGLPSDAIAARFRLNQNWVSLAHKQPPEVSAQIKALKLRGIGLQPESKRVYPGGSLAAQLLGFTSYDGIGQYGLESRYNDQLSGTPGSLTVERDVTGVPINLEDQSMKPPHNGADLYLTIDRTIQFTAERQLAIAVKQHEAAGGTAIVMDPHSGAILALANVPSYDPNSFETTDNALFNDPAISSPYEPGSTFKVITMSAGLDLHQITPETTMLDKGTDTIAGYTIYDWDRKAHGYVSMADVLAHSLNLGAAFVGRRVGAPDFYRYVRNFGFGQPTGIDLQGEAPGFVRTPTDTNWYPVDLSTNSFGQGLTATPLQITVAVASVANGGAMMRPYVVRKVVQDGVARPTVPTIEGHPITPETARAVTDMMVEVLVKGEGYEAHIPGYVVAGKTGTASIAEHGVYLDDATIASFVGFVPAENAAFVIFVKLDRPKDSPWGSETAAPLFQAIAKDLLLYMHIPPTEAIPTPAPTPPGPVATMAPDTARPIRAAPVVERPIGFRPPAPTRANTPRPNATPTRTSGPPKR
jgi:cell division protein FtsI/penicillin-binding protein 2